MDDPTGEKAQREREERAYERGEHVDRAEGIEEKRARLREWDIAMGHWMPALAAVFLLSAALPASAENCIVLALKTAKYSVTKVQKVATAWKTELVVNPATGLHESVQVPTAWTNETVSMGTFYGIAEVMAAMKADAKPGISYKLTQPGTIYAAAIPNTAKGGICLDAIDDRLLINRPGVR